MIYDANNKKSIIEAAINDLIDLYFVGLDDKDIEYRLNTYFFLNCGSLSWDPDCTLERFEEKNLIFYRVTLEEIEVEEIYSEEEFKFHLVEILNKYIQKIIDNPDEKGIVEKKFNKQEIMRILNRYDLGSNSRVVEFQDSRPRMPKKKWWQRLSNYLFNP